MESHDFAEGKACVLHEELVEDVLSVITVFSAKLYGSRSHKNKKIKEINSKLFRGGGEDDL